MGSVSGSSYALYEIESDFRLESFDKPTFNQLFYVKGEKKYIEIRVDIKEPLKEIPFRMSKETIKKFKKLEDSVSRKVFQVFSSSNTLSKVLPSLFLVLKESFIYEPKDELDLRVDEILKRNRASCLSLSKLAQFYLQLAQIESEIHIAIKFPLDRDSVELKGGILHSFLIINLNDSCILCDPLFSVGFIPENYIYLCSLKDLSDSTLKKLAGSKIKLLSHEDRIFYNPQTISKVELWKPDLDRTIGGALIGKVLKEKDIFEEGYIVIKSGQDEVKIGLMNGNFCFFVESDGEYTIFFENVLGVRRMIKRLFLSHRNVKKVVFYLK